MGLVGVAADPDFTETLIRPTLSPETLAEIEEKGIADFQWCSTRNHLFFFSSLLLSA